MERGVPWRTLWQFAGMSMGTYLVVVGVGQAGHQRRVDPAAASDDQGGGASGHGRQCARPMSRCLGHLVCSLPPPSNSAIGPALWARRGTIRPSPGVKLEPPQPTVVAWPSPPSASRREERGVRRPLVGPDGSSRRVRASAERGRVQGPGRAEADLGPRPPDSAQPYRAEQGNLARRSRHHGRVPEVDDDQLAALRRLRAAFGPIEVVEVISDDPAATQGELTRKLVVVHRLLEAEGASPSASRGRIRCNSCGLASALSGDRSTTSVGGSRHGPPGTGAACFSCFAAGRGRDLASEATR